MTVSSSTDRATFLGNDATTVFALPFRFFANGEINAWLITNATGALTALTLGTHYTLTGASDPEVDGSATGQLTMITPPTSAQSLFVQRIIPVTQPTDIVNQGQFFPEIHENVFDRLTMLSQQNAGAISRVIRVQDFDPEPTKLPSAAQRALKIMSFDADGNPVAIDAASDSSLVLRQDLANDTDPAKGAALVGYSGGTVYSKLGRIRDVIDNGAAGDGVTPDQAAFLSSAANGTVIVPPGVYSIAANTVLDADLIVMRGALIKAEAGITVTVNGSINAPMDKIFSGAGSVVFGKQVQIAHPEWFGAAALPYVEGTDFPAIQKCVTACSANEVLTFLGQDYFGSPGGVAVQLSLSTPIGSKPGVIINGLAQPRCFDFETGNYDGAKFVFPTLTSFNTSYIRLKGVNFARIEIESISNGSGAGVVLETVQTTHERCLDNKIDVHIANNIGAVFLFQGGESNTSVLQGNELYCNFALACEYGCLFFIPTVGSTPFWDSNKVVFQAIDGIGVANARGLSNSSAHSVPRLIFRVETWFGGFEPTGVWADGRFDGLDAYIAPASEIPSYGAWSIIGQGNKINQITSGLNIATKSYAVGTTANSRASFNAGAPVTENRFAIIYTVPGGGIAVNAVFALYFYSPYFDSGSNKISAQSINYSGAIAEVVSRGANPNEGVITMRNISGVVIPAGTSIQFYVEVG